MRPNRKSATATALLFVQSDYWAVLQSRRNSIAGQEGGSDVLDAGKVWLYATLLTIGYMISRGLAKSGSRDPYDADRRGASGR